MTSPCLAQNRLREIEPGVPHPLKSFLHGIEEVPEPASEVGDALPRHVADLREYAEATSLPLLAPVERLRSGTELPILLLEEGADTHGPTSQKHLVDDEAF